MPADCGSGGSTLLSRLDLSDAENVKDADHQLQRCVTDADYAGWARKWGGASMSKLLNGPDRADVEDSPEYQSVSDGLTAMESAATEAVADLEKVLEHDDLPAPLTTLIESVVTDLETALREVKS